MSDKLKVGTIDAEAENFMSELGTLPHRRKQRAVSRSCFVACIICQLVYGLGIKFFNDNKLGNKKKHNLK
jgi:hypothetical protein